LGKLIKFIFIVRYPPPPSNQIPGIHLSAMMPIEVCLMLLT